MNFERILLSNIVLIPLGLAIVAAVLVTFLPLAGVLGFEYSAIMGFALSLISVFMSAEIMDRDQKSHSAGRRLSDRVSAVFMINIIMLIAVFLVGLVSSLIKDDCNIREGAVFYLLITCVSVFFSASLGMLTGFLLRRRGFIVGALIIIGTIVYSLYVLYSEPSLFVYNPVFGFFPGPIYDAVLPVTTTLLAARAITVLWGCLFLALLSIANGLGYSRIGAWDFVKLIALVALLAAAHVYRSELGISFSREYITEEILPASIETSHFVIYYDPGSPAARHIDLIADEHEWRYAQLAEYLDVNSADKIRSYIYPNAQTRKRVVGAGDTTIANPIHKEIHLVYDSYPHQVLKHELVHVMSADFGHRFLKISPKIGLLEGLAVAADWSGDDFTPHQWSKLIIEAGLAPDIESITGLGFWYASPGVSYTLMGSFSRYLIDRYGIETYKKVYGSGDFSAYGKPLRELIAEWEAFLETVPTPPEAAAMAEARFDAPGIFGAVCARKVAALKEKAFANYAAGNLWRAGEIFSEARGYDENDPMLINGLAYSAYYSGDYQGAIEIAGQPAGLSKVDRIVLSNLRANALWQAGDTDAALEIFDGIEKRYLPDDVQRELDIKISAIREGGSAEEGAREFFATRDRALQAIAMEEAIQGAPGYAPAYYLIGRQLFNAGEHTKAVPYLETARYLGLPSDRLASENLRLLGTSLFAEGDYEGAAAVFRELASLSPRDESYAADFLGRINRSEQNILK
ncbi:MAG TPA: hypothetical protein PKC29_13380 [Thermodesulfobacteriota bacterium]|nr:hypothetical protein [Thermodesulfobacteriota bacterium]